MKSSIIRRMMHVILAFLLVSNPLLAAFYPLLPVPLIPAPVSAASQQPTDLENTTVPLGDNTVSITDAAFVPDVITVSVGQSVTWTNNGTVSHQVKSGTPTGMVIYLPLLSRNAVAGIRQATPSSRDSSSEAPSAGNDWNSGVLKPSESFSHTFDSAGSYDYYDPLHPELTGRVVVSPSGLTLNSIGNQSMPLGSTLTLQLEATYDGENPLSFGVSPMPLPDNASFNAMTGLFSFTPTEIQTGTFELTFSVTDDKVSDSEPITITVPEPDPNGETALRGRIVDANDATQGIITPLAGATVTHLESGMSATTGSDGYFTLTALPAGASHFEYDARTVTSGTYGAYRSEKYLIAHVTNILERPIYIMQIDTAGEVDVDPNDTTVVNNPNIDTTVTIPPHTVMDESGNEFDGMISISPVPAAFTPGSLPETLVPDQVITVQPMGLTFDTPAPVTFPNTSGLSPGSEVDIWSMDHSTSEFFVAGTGRVTDDGTMIETIAGGIREASWHFPMPPAPPDDPPSDEDGDNQDPPECDFASTLSPHNGCLGTTISLPSYLSLGESRANEFVYKSNRAYPQPIIPIQSIIPRRGPVPSLVSYELTVGGVAQGEATYIDTSSLSESMDEPLRAATSFDGSTFSTGVYPHRIRLTSHYANSSVSSNIVGRTMIVNEQESPFGAGWALAGLQKANHQLDGRVLITQGDGSTQLFTPGNLEAENLFDVAPRYPAGNTPVVVASGDFDSNGTSDLAITNFDSNNVSILLGDGTGAFSEPTNFAVGNEPKFLALGDFDDNGTLDLAVINRLDDNVSLLLGNGSGGFGSPTNFAVGSEPDTIATADLDGNETLDLVVSNRADDTISILLGNGTGAFSAPTNLEVGNNPEFIAIADFDSNGALDLAVANRSDDNVSILLGDGSGDFSAPTNFDVKDQPDNIAVGDFDGSGTLDLAVANGNSDSVSILFGDGDGTFSLLTKLLVGAEPESIAAADFDRNGTLDLVTTNSGSDDISVLFGDGRGAFSAPTHFIVGERPLYVALADFDGNETLDFAVVNDDSNDISIVLGDGTGAFSAPTNFPAGNHAVFLTAGDWDSNGTLDLAVANFNDDNVSVLLGNGSGNFSAPSNFTVGNEPKWISVGDFDGSGTLDLAVANRLDDNVSILLGDGNGAFSEPSNFAVGNDPDSIAVADFNDDGTPDLAVSNREDDNVSILLGDGTGSFSAPTNLTAGNQPEFIAVADFDGNGTVDLAISNRLSNNLSILLGNGNGTFSSATTFAVGNGPDDIAVADFDGNGTQDIAVTNGSSDQVSILLGDGLGAFSAPINVTVGDAPEGIGTADLNGNGIFDLVVTNSDSNDVSFLLGDGTGAFSVSPQYAVGNNPLNVALGDFDQNGTLDVAVVNSESNSVSLLFGKPNQLTDLSSPEGDFSTLIENDDGSFTRRMKDGTEYHFNANGLQTSMVDRNGNTTTYAYDASNRLISITDPAGLVTTLTYSDEHLSSVSDPTGRETSFEHDANGNLVGVTFPDDSSQSFAYDERHLMTSETDRRGFTTTRNYDQWGRMSSATMPDGSIRQATFSQGVGLIDPDSGVGSQDNPAPIVRPDEAVSTLIDGEGRTTTYTIGSQQRFGGITDPAGFTTTTRRDDDGNPLQTTRPSGAVFANSYDQQGNQLTFTDETVDGTTSFTYENTFNQVTSITDPFGEVTNIQYDDQGNPTQTTTPLGRTITFDYDNRGLLTNLIDTLGTESVFNYDSQGNLTQVVQGEGSDQRSATLDYTDAGYVEGITDPQGRTFDFSYDALGRLTSETLPANRTIAYQYDADGNLSALTPPSRPAHTFEYNEQGFMTAYIPPTVDGSGSTRTTYEYNNAQELTQITRPDGQELTVSYDDAGRLTTLTLPRGPISVAYDENTGQLTTTGAPDGINLTYNYLGSLLTDVTWSGPIAGTVSHTVDANYRTTELSVNDNAITYQYDADDALTQAGDLNLTYNDSSGLLTNTDLGNVSDNLTYNQFASLSSYRASYNSNDLYNTTYTRDKLGRITELTETIDGTTITYNYTYDAAGRLAQIERNGTTIATYTYDANGNRLTFTSPSGTINGTYDDQDRLLTYGNNTYTYTANGELTSKSTSGQTTTYDYDVLGNLMSVTLPDATQIEYLIDGEDRRIGKKVNGTLTQAFLYEDDLNPIAELDANGDVISRFVYGSMSNVPDYMTKDGTTYRIISDHLGSVRLVVNTQTGNIAQRMDVDAFGNVTQDTNPGFQPFGFAGGLYDVDTGLVRFGARDYDAETGRWTVKDPIGFEGDGPNLYVYVGNDPVNWIDETGEGRSGRGKGERNWAKDNPNPDKEKRQHPQTGKKFNDDRPKSGKEKAKKLKLARKSLKIIPGFGLIFLLLDIAEAAELSQDPCADFGDYLNIVVPYKDIASLF